METVDWLYIVRTLTIMKQNDKMDTLNFHEMALDELEQLKEYLLDSRNVEEEYSERGELNQKILLVDKAIHDKKQLLNG